MEWIDKMLMEAKSLNKDEIDARAKFYKNYGDIKFRNQVTCDVCGLVVDVDATAPIENEFVCCVCLYKRGRMVENYPGLLKSHS